MRRRYLEGRRKGTRVLRVGKESVGIRSETSLAIFFFELIRLSKQRERDTKKRVSVDYIYSS
jgi:hypothetical protein